jgi:hypothetical protein
VRQRHLHRVFYGDREGEHPDTVAYFPAMDYGADANRTLELQARKDAKILIAFRKNSHIVIVHAKTRFLFLRTAKACQNPILKKCFIGTFKS